MFFNFTLEDAIRRVQVNQEGLKLNAALQLPVYAEDCNILCEVYILKRKKKKKALVVACKEIILEVNAEKTKYMDTCQGQNAGQNYNTKIDNKPFKRVEQFKYMGTTLTHQNSILEEIKSRLKAGNACYHSV